MRWVIDYAALSKWVHPAVVAGSLSSVMLFLFVDAVIIGSREILSHDQFTFTMALPLIFSIMGLVTVNMTQPADFHEYTTEAAKSRGFLFAGWVMLLSATIIAWVQCVMNFVGEGTRLSVFPGVAMVSVTTVAPLATVALWWSKGVVAGGTSDELEW